MGNKSFDFTYEIPDNNRSHEKYPVMRIEESYLPEFEVFLSLGSNPVKGKFYADDEKHVYLTAEEAEEVALSILVELQEQGKLSFSLGQT